jgi:hypothetical protein
MSEHPLDRFARRLAGGKPDQAGGENTVPLSADRSLRPSHQADHPKILRHVSRRWLLRTAAVSTGAAIVPWRLAAPPSSRAAGTTSCDCQGYADQQWIDCYNDYVGNAPSGGGVEGAIQFGIAHAGGEHYCKGKDTEAHATCTQVPCQAGYTCVADYDVLTATTLTPQCKPDCPPGSGQTKCGDQCVDLQTDKNNCGSCGHVCVGNSICQKGRCTGPCGDPPNAMCKCDPSANCSGDNPAVGYFCTDTQCDSANCGACGNDCGCQPTSPFTCQAGRCQCGSCVYEPGALSWCGPCCNGKPC